jgi:LPS sulfotransferase NodH
MGAVLERTAQKVIQLRDLSLHYLRNFALEKGWLVGHSDYTRFIILGRSRVGSNLLRGLLNSHSQISVFGEIFQNEKAIGWAMPGYRQSGRLLQQFRHQPVALLEEKVFRRFPPHIAAVGFKIFYYHAQTEHWKPVWEYLRSQTAIRVLHIKRRNILETHLSRKRAAMTDVWVNTTGQKDGQPTVTLNYDECLADFTQTRECENSYDRFFSDHPLMEIAYEDLSADISGCMAQVQAFLGVDHEVVMPVTHKQAMRPLSSSISNYTELKERFAGSPWESFFID